MRFCIFAAFLLVTRMLLAAAPEPPPVSVTDAQRREFFAALDLDQPGLDPVRQAVRSGDLPAAQSAFATWLRERRITTWRFDPRSASVPDAALRFDRQAAADAVRGRIVVVEIAHDFPGNDIDWHHNPTRNAPGIAYNPEWQWQLCRMTFWHDLAAAWRATGDERYARAWVAQLRSFVSRCPVPGDAANKHGSAWRTIEAGIRMNRWPEAFHSFLLSPDVTDEDLFLYAYSTLQHGRYLRAHSTSANWLTIEMSGLYAAGTIFPEFKEAGEWRHYAAARLHEEITVQFLPDGAHYEYTPGYHNGALTSVLAIPNLAKATGRLGEIPPGYITALERAFDYNLRLMTPDRSLPRFNDSWPVDVPRVFRRQALTYFSSRPDYQWIASDGARGVPPTAAGSSASHAFHYAGYYVMRSGWERDANYAVLDAGQLGYGHVHQDKLNLVLWAYGREILFDSGGGSYERSKWRAYATDTFSHNTVLMDGKPQRRQTSNREANVSRSPVDARWQSTPEHDYVTGVYDEGYGDEKPGRVRGVHTRRVRFQKPDIFVVVDTLQPEAGDTAGHTWQARWHLLSTATRTDAATQATFTTDAGQPNLAIIPLRTTGLDVQSAVARTEPEILGWHVRKDQTPQTLPATTLLHTRRGSGEQTFITLLLPLPKDANPAVNPVTGVEHLSPVVSRVTFADGRLLTIDTGAASDAPLTVSESRP